MVRLPTNAYLADEVPPLDQSGFRSLLRRSTGTILAALGMPLLVLLLLVLFLRHAGDQLDQSGRVIAASNQVEKLLVTMQTALRDFGAVTDPRLRERYRTASSQLEEPLRILAAAVSDDPRQQATWREMEADTRRWVGTADAALARMLAGRPTEGERPALMAVRSTYSAALAHAQDLIEAEERLRAARNQAIGRVVTTLLALFLGAACLGIPALSWWLQRLLGRVSGYYRAGLVAAERRAAELEVTVAEKRAAEHRLRESERRLRFLNELSEATRPLLDAAEIMQVSTRLLGTHFEVSGCAYAEVDADGNTFVVPQFYAAHPTQQGGADRLDRFGPALVDGLREGRTVRVANARTELPAGSAAALTASGVEAVVSYPLLKAGALVAVLVVYQHAPRAWSDAEVTLLAEVGERCRATVERARAETNLRSARDQAERASRTKDDFLASLSHELRTPLTPVLVTAAALREDERLPADVRAHLRMMERNIALEARLIDDLLDLTTISRGRLQLRKQVCDVHSLIGLAVEIVQPEACAKAIAIDRAFAAAHSGMQVDPARFQQVMWNLLRNAVKFTPRGGRIALGTREEVGPDGQIWLRIEVADSGIGIDPALLNQIFLPFDQGALTGDHRFGGMGLGLAIARAVVDLHGGRITARSAGANHGATFLVELPGAFTPPVGHEPAGPPHAPATAEASAVVPLRLLLVEDHENTLQALLRLLQRDGHQVAAAPTATEALAAAAHGSFDLVISDLGLPDGSGIELMGKLRAAYGLRGIALSGYGMESDLKRSRAAGFVTHLVKPVNIGDLRKALTETTAGAGAITD